VSAASALALLSHALDLPAGARVDFIRSQAGDDPELRDTALALLAAHRDSEGFLATPAATAVPRVLGPYRLLTLLGAGGMGVVHLAERCDGSFEQQVAIKLLAHRFASPEQLRRAEAERRFLARLQHPNIARILDAGSTEDGQPYVVMEHVDGLPIDRYCSNAGLDLRERVSLFGQVLAAVDAAHRALIIHRDLKPANVLVTSAGEVKLLDFGIAKALDDPIDGGATGTGMTPLTPRYASPEQLRGEPLTTASDIYSLGLLLFELVTGQLPAAQQRDDTRLLAQRIAESPPTRPSAHLDPQALGLAGRALPNWRRQLSGDLDRVLQKALAAEPERRYFSVAAFAEDLARWSDNRPVLARDGGALYRLGKFGRRHRLPVTAAAAAVLALALGLAVAASQAHRAQAEAERAQQSNRFLLELISHADPMVSGRPPSLLDALDRAASAIGARFAGQPMLEADVRHAIGRAYLSLERLDEASEHLRRAEQLRAGGDAREHAEALGSVAALEWSLGRYEAAEARFRQALDRLGAAPADAGRRAQALNDYSALLNELGRYDEAIAAVEQALELSTGSPVAPRERAVMLGNLGYARHGRAELSAADAAYAEARRLFERVHATAHPDLAINLSNHAAVLRDLDRQPEALALMERSIALRREIYGPEHPMSVTGMANLARQYVEAGQPDAAGEAIAFALLHAPGAFAAGNQTLGHVYLIAADVAMAAADPALALSRAEQALQTYAAAEAVEPGRRERALELATRARQALDPR